MAGLIVVSPDHVRDTLAEHLPSAEQALGHPDVTGRGHAQNVAFWTAMERRGAIARS